MDDRGLRLSFVEFLQEAGGQNFRLDRPQVSHITKTIVHRLLTL